MPISEKNWRGIEARGLDVELLENYGVSDSERPGFDIVFNYLVRGEVVARKHRRIMKSDRAANFVQDPGGRQVLWNHACLGDETLAHQPLVITEGEFDAPAAIQGGFVRAVSVPNGAPVEGEHEGGRYRYLEDVPPDANEIILAVDSDEPGKRLLHAISMRLGADRCKWVEYPKGCKDLGDVLRVYGAVGVAKVLAAARWFAVPGLYHMPELPPLPEQPPHDVGIPGLEKHYRARLGDFTVVTGIPSAGKSALVTAMACHFARKHGWPVAMASLETRPQAELRQYLRSWYLGGLVKDYSAEHVARADEWIAKWFLFIVPSFEDDADLKWIMERMRAAVIRYGAKVIIIDPFNEIESPILRDMKETDYIGECIKRLKRFAVKYLVHIIVVVHPAKMQREKGVTPIPTLYDSSGSAHWVNKPDVGLIVHRPEQNQTLIRVSKVRHRVIGVPGEVTVYYDWKAAKYVGNGTVSTGRHDDDRGV